MSFEINNVGMNACYDKKSASFSLDSPRESRQKSGDSSMGISELGFDILSHPTKKGEFSQKPVIEKSLNGKDSEDVLCNLYKFIIKGESECCESECCESECCESDYKQNIQEIAIDYMKQCHSDMSFKIILPYLTGPNAGEAITKYLLTAFKQKEQPLEEGRGNSDEQSIYKIRNFSSNSGGLSLSGEKTQNSNQKRKRKSYSIETPFDQMILNQFSNMLGNHDLLQKELAKGFVMEQNVLFDKIRKFYGLNDDQKAVVNITGPDSFDIKNKFVEARFPGATCNIENKIKKYIEKEFGSKFINELFIDFKKISEHVPSPYNDVWNIVEFRYNQGFTVKGRTANLSECVYVIEEIAATVVKISSRSERYQLKEEKSSDEKRMRGFRIKGNEMNSAKNPGLYQYFLYVSYSNERQDSNKTLFAIAAVKNGKLSIKQNHRNLYNSLVTECILNS